MNATPLVDATVLAGDGWTYPIKKGQTFRIVDLEGNQAVDTLFYNLHDVAERYDATLTMRRQGSLYLTTGTRLLSSEGNALLTITEDTCGRHDTVGGACSCESNQVRYDLGKLFMHSCRTTFLQQATSVAPKFGVKLGKRDLAHNINFFMNVPVTPEGGLKFDDGISGPGRYVQMVADMDVLVVISNCPQLNNPCNGWNPTPIRCVIWE